MCPFKVLNHDNSLSCIMIQCQFCSLCGSLRVTAVQCYQLLYLHWYPPPLLWAHRFSRGTSRGALVMHSSGNPNPHYRPHYSVLHNRSLFSGFKPFPLFKTHRHIYSNAPHTHVRLGLYSYRLSFCGPMPWWSGVHVSLSALLYWSTKVDSFETSTSPFISSLYLSLSFFFVVLFCFLTTSFIILSCHDGECMWHIPLYSFPLGQGKPGQFLIQSTKGQQLLLSLSVDK